MEACVRHLRVPKDNPAGRASFLLIEDTLQTLGQRAICLEVTNLLLFLAESLVIVVSDCHHFAGGISVAVACCAESSSVHAHLGVSL